MKIKLYVSVIVTGMTIAALTGCGTGANLAGLSVAANVVQNGQVLGLTAAGGTNTLAVGVSYGKSTNDINATVTIPVGK
jgi:hypothetical protein